MKEKALKFLAVLFLTGLSWQTYCKKNQTHNPYYSRTDTTKLRLSNAEWKKVLSKELYAVAREGATETAFTGHYDNFNEKGTYYCSACGNALFLSTAKFSSTCGWPSFYQPVRKGSVEYKKDHSHQMVRTEVICGRCDAHLGHVFDDGPKPTGKRFCMNSVSLEFVPLSKKIKQNKTN